MNRGAWQLQPMRSQELDTTEQLSSHTHLFLTWLHYLAHSPETEGLSINPSSMAAGVCGAQAPLLRAEVHRSRHAKNERERKGWGQGKGHRSISAGNIRSQGKVSFKLLS